MKSKRKKTTAIVHRPGGQKLNAIKYGLNCRLATLPATQRKEILSLATTIARDVEADGVIEEKLALLAAFHLHRLERAAVADVAKARRNAVRAKFQRDHPLPSLNDEHEPPSDEEVDQLSGLPHALSDPLIRVETHSLRIVRRAVETIGEVRDLKRRPKKRKAPIAVSIRALALLEKNCKTDLAPLKVVPAKLIEHHEAMPLPAELIAAQHGKPSAVRHGKAGLRGRTSPR